MTITQREFLLDLIDDSLSEHEEHAQHFAEPVDIAELDCPDYYDYVTEPLDLQIMRQNLDDFAREFQIHFDVLLANAIQLNGMESVVAKHVICLENAFRPLHEGFKESE